MTQGLELRTVVDLTPDRPTAISEQRRRASALRGGAVTPKLTRLLAVGALAAGFGVVLPMPGASAATDRGVIVYDMPTGFQQDVNANGQCHSTSDYKEMPTSGEVDPGDSVSWYMSSENQKNHNITPANDVPGGQHWPASTPKTTDLAAGEKFVVTFTNAPPGYYFYYSSANGEGTDKKGVLDGMCGVIHVRGTTTTTPPPVTTDTTPDTSTTTAPPASTGTTATTAPATASPSANHPGTLAPAPTTTTAPKAEKDKKPKDETTTTTTAPPANGPDLPAEAIVPNVNPTGTATQDGVVQPSSTPTGDATAVIKQKHGHGPVILLVLSGLGIGGLGVGTGLYKWANRSSRYFPA
jgi:plastocyanin